MKRIVVCFTLLSVLLAACQLAGLPSVVTPMPPAAHPSPARGYCGDGRCDSPENAQNCPADCAAPSPTTVRPPATRTPAAATPTPSRGQGVLYLGIMVHLEGWDDARDRAKFERHVQLVREYASLFETYGAKLTLESKELTEGILRWGDIGDGAARAWGRRACRHRRPEGL